MGCDIHTHIEIKRRGAETWEHYAAPQVRHRYDLFALMGPCRRRVDIEPIAPSRGLPWDASLVTVACYKHEAADAHGASWLGAAEIEVLRGRFEEIRAAEGDTNHLDNDLEHGVFHTYLLDNALTALDGTPFEDVRIVFWFDN